MYENKYICGGVIMNYEDVQKVSNAAKAKSNLVNTNFFKYFVRAVMAGHDLQ